MKKYEWLRKEDLNRLATDEDYAALEMGMFFETQKTLGFVVACVAIATKTQALLRFALDNAIITDEGDKDILWRRSGFDCESVLIEYGFSDKGKSVYIANANFIQSRNLARSSAILVMHAMYKMDKKYKNVSVIIGRAIWASRWDAENWLKWEKSLKK